MTQQSLTDVASEHASLRASTLDGVDSDATDSVGNAHTEWAICLSCETTFFRYADDVMDLVQFHGCSTWRVYCAQVWVFDGGTLTVDDGYRNEHRSDRPKICVTETMLDDMGDAPIPVGTGRKILIDKDSHFERVDRETLLFDTVEGVHFLVSLLDLCGIDSNLCDLSMRPDYRLSDFRELRVSHESNKWTDESRTQEDPVETDSGDTIQPASIGDLRSDFTDRIDTHGDGKYVYVLRLRHTDDAVLGYYVGKSGQPYGRLETHHSSGGDFSGSEQYIITGVEDAFHGRTEKDVYNEMVREYDSSVTVLGGR